MGVFSRVSAWGIPYRHGGNDRGNVSLASRLALLGVVAALVAPPAPAKADFLDASTMISDVIGLIEKRENITIDRSGFNASRFITHMEYLLARIRNNETL